MSGSTIFISKVEMFHLSTNIFPSSFLIVETWKEHDSRNKWSREVMKIFAFLGVRRKQDRCILSLVCKPSFPQRYRKVIPLIMLLSLELMVVLDNFGQGFIDTLKLMNNKQRLGIKSSRSKSWPSHHNSKNDSLVI